MSADPLWYSLRVLPKDCAKVKEAFDRAVKDSKISHKLDEYLSSRKHRSPTFDQESQESWNQSIPGAFASSSDPDAYDWEDLHSTYNLFFPKEFDKLVDNLFNPANPLISASREESEVDFIMTNRVGASEILYGGLGWKRANSLPGYYGNMFVPFEELEKVTRDVEQMFNELDIEDFIGKAIATASRGNCNEDIIDTVIQFPLALSKVLSEGNGFLALNHSDLGSLSIPEEELGMGF